MFHMAEPKTQKNDASFDAFINSIDDDIKKFSDIDTNILEVIISDSFALY